MQRGFLRHVAIAAALVFIGSTGFADADIRDNNCAVVRTRVHQLAAQDIGVREKTGRNDHPLIAQWNKRVGAPINASYCASWIVNKLLDAGVADVPVTAWSPSLLPKSKRLMWAGKLIAGKKLSSMDVLGMYFASKKRIAHVAFYHFTVGDHIRSMEANSSITAVDGSAEDRDATTGGGVVYKTRHRRVWYGASRFITC